MAITVLMLAADYSAALMWRSLSISESIGQPDTLSVEMFELDASVRTLLGQDRFIYIQVRKDGDYLDNPILFSGVVTGLRRRNNHGAVSYILSAVGWESLAPKRLVGRPAGDQSLIQGAGDPDRLPTSVAVDPSATQKPTVTGVGNLWSAYWSWPQPLDVVTYVSEIVPDPSAVDEITWSGSDMAGAMDDLCAAGSAAAMWWLANDSPFPQQAYAPYLALHFGLVTLPDEGEDPDDLLLGLPTADVPTNVAPYAISDTPDWVTSIMASAVPEINFDNSQRVDAVYVRGATGFTQSVEVAPAGNPEPYVVGVIVQGGTGWVGSPGSIWGEAYVDAPAAVSPDQRDAFGSAYLGAHGGRTIDGTFLVEGYDGWHKGQAVMVTDSGLGLDERWLLIRSAAIKANDPMGEALSYTLTVGDTLTAELGYQLRRQRLKEARQEIAPATRFIPYVGDLTLAPGETAPLTFQLANDAGKAMAVKNVGAVWHLLLNGADMADPEDAAAAFYLTDLIETTDDKGQVTATLHAGATATTADAVRPWVAMVP